jgi:hypothetical protein
VHPRDDDNEEENELVKGTGVIHNDGDNNVSKYCFYGVYNGILAQVTMAYVAAIKCDDKLNASYAKTKKRRSKEIRLLEDIMHHGCINYDNSANDENTKKHTKTTNTEQDVLFAVHTDMKSHTEGCPLEKAWCIQH